MMRELGGRRPFDNLNAGLEPGPSLLVVTACGVRLPMSTHRLDGIKA